MWNDVCTRVYDPVRVSDIVCLWLCARLCDGVCAGACVCVCARSCDLVSARVFMSGTLGILKLRTAVHTQLCAYVIGSLTNRGKLTSMHVFVFSFRERLFNPVCPCNNLCIRVCGICTLLAAV